MWIPRIRDIREAKGLKQKYIAKQIHVSAQRISDWEHGKSYPRSDHLFDLAQVLGCKVDELYRREMDEGNNN